MIEVQIKPLSVNRAWQGKRYKTKDYKEYERELLYILPKYEIPEGQLKATFEVCYKSRLNDIDNFLKPFIDVLQKKYGFNDRDIYELNIKKVIGENEYIKFSLTA